MTNKQTLVQAVYLATSGRSHSLQSARNTMLGLPCGGWAETTQGYRQMLGELPVRSLRAYTADQFLEATCCLDSSDRFRARDTSDALREAARIEAEVAS
jgi:hypothetical protein